MVVWLGWGLIMALCFPLSRGGAQQGLYPTQPPPGYSGPQSPIAQPGLNSQSYLANAALTSTNGFRSGKIVLKRTPVAPLTAGGTVQLNSQPGSTNGPFSLSVKMQGLNPGTYWLKAVRTGNGGTLVLGSLVLSDPTAVPSGASWENQKEAGADESSLLQIRSQVGLPPGVRPNEIGSIMVTDSGGTALLLGP